MKAVAKAGQSRAVLFGRRCVRYAADMAGGQRILIVVGGTAGWLAAAYLARSLGRSVRITLLESPEIGTIGVGEGTFPTIRDTLRFLGIDEASFVRRASATFKQGVRFTGWQPSVGDRPHSYFRPFEPPFGAEEASLVPHWLLQDEATRPPVAEAVTIQNRVADAKRAPKQPGEATSPGRSTTPSISTRRNCRACPPIAPGNWEWRIWPVRVTEVILDDRGRIARLENRCRRAHRRPVRRLHGLPRRADRAGAALPVPPDRPPAFRYLPICGRAATIVAATARNDAPLCLLILRSTAGMASLAERSRRPRRRPGRIT